MGDLTTESYKGKSVLIKPVRFIMMQMVLWRAALQVPSLALMMTMMMCSSRGMELEMNLCHSALKDAPSRFLRWANMSLGVPKRLAKMVLPVPWNSCFHVP